MGRRITIHRPERLKFVKRPPTSKQKEASDGIARFYADDVTWAAPGPITATHVATPEGMRLINPDGTLGPVEEGVELPPGHPEELLRGISYHTTRTGRGRNGRQAGGEGPRNDGVPFTQDRDVTITVRRDAAGRRIMPFEGPVMLGASGVSVTNTDPDDIVRVVLAGDDGVPPEQYHYTYSGGLPIWRQHNVSGERDAAHCFDNDMTDRWDIQWTHAGSTVPVHIEHVERSAVGDTPDQDGLVNGRTVTVADVHRAMHPGADLPLTHSERQEILSEGDGMMLPQDATDAELVEAQNTTRENRVLQDAVGRHNSNNVLVRTARPEEAPQRPTEDPYEQEALRAKLAATANAQTIRMMRGAIHKSYLNKYDWFVRWRHWQGWKKSPVGDTQPLTYTERGPISLRKWSTPIIVIYWTLFSWFVGIPGYELLQLLNQ